MPSTYRYLPTILIALTLSAGGTASAQIMTDTVAGVTSVTATYGYSPFFGDGPDPWHFASLSLGHKTTHGSAIGRANFAHRFGTSGTQGELDLYPRIARNIYAYLNVGVSNSTIFPELRTGAELFGSLNRVWEASIGYRYLRFPSEPTTIFTGAIGKYDGNWWTSVRPYIRHRDDGLAMSVGITTRHYTSDADNYIGASFSAGSSPTDRVDASQLSQTNSWNVGLHGSRSLKPRVAGTWSVGYFNERLPSATTRRRLDTEIGIRFDR